MKRFAYFFKELLKHVGVWLLLIALFLITRPGKEPASVKAERRMVQDTAREEAEFYRSLSMPEDVTTDR